MSYRPLPGAWLRRTDGLRSGVADVRCTNSAQNRSTTRTLKAITLAMGCPLRPTPENRPVFTTLQYSKVPGFHHCTPRVNSIPAPVSVSYSSTGWIITSCFSLACGPCTYASTDIPITVPLPPCLPGKVPIVMCRRLPSQLVPGRRPATAGRLAERTGARPGRCHVSLPRSTLPVSAYLRHSVTEKALTAPPAKIESRCFCPVT